MNSDLEAWQEVTDTNYYGTIRVLRAALPLMPQEGEVAGATTNKNCFEFQIFCKLASRAAAGLTLHLASVLLLGGTSVEK